MVKSLDSRILARAELEFKLTAFTVMICRHEYEIPLCIKMFKINQQNQLLLSAPQKSQILKT